MKSRSEAARIGIVIYDGVEPIDVGGTAGVVSMARRVLPGIACVMIAERTGPVRLAGDVTVMADADFHNARRAMCSSCAAARAGASRCAIRRCSIS